MGREGGGGSAHEGAEQGPPLRLPGRRTVAGLLAFLVLAVLALQLPRLRGIAAGSDLSAQARFVYYRAAWRGFLARSALGWGPGSAPWTAAAFFDPAPGLRPWGESVGELHSLPLQLAYESGIPGALLSLAIAGLFAWRRLTPRAQSRDPALVKAGLLGLLGAAVASLGSGALTVTALPLAAAVAAGAALAGGPEPAEPESSALPVRLYAAIALLLLSPLALALRHYDRAVTGPPAEASAELARAVGLDPAFPLYRMRLALLQPVQPVVQTAGADSATQAAEDGGEIPTLWLVAGLLETRAHRPGPAAEALTRACALDPLGGFAPFYLAASEPRSPDAPARGAHAVLADPRLAAAVFWESHPTLLQSALGEAAAWPGVDPAWRTALSAALPRPGDPLDEKAWLELGIDTTPNLALSLHTFRRRPWPAWWQVVQVRRHAAERLQLLPPALRDDAAAAQARRPCFGSARKLRP